MPALGSDFVDNDRLEPGPFNERLEWARGRIAETAERLRRGELACTPDTCAWNGGCSHPSICRVEE
jgi:hypothetical protein